MKIYNLEISKMSSILYGATLVMSMISSGGIIWIAQDSVRHANSSHFKSYAFFSTILAIGAVQSLALALAALKGLF